MEPDQIFDDSFTKVVGLGNQIAESNQHADAWDIADGLLAGAIQFWLYSRQPCGDPRCEDCLPIASAAQRLTELLRVTEEFAKDSEYYHAPTDIDVGRA